MIKVEALKTYEENSISDNELNRIPKEGETWEVSKERLDVLLGNNSYGKIFVKVVEEEKNLLKRLQRKKKLIVNEIFK